MSTWAIVTGASGGLGRAYARYLASTGLDVGLVARSEAPMTRLAGELTERFGVNARVWTSDLTRDADRRQLIDDLTQLDVDTLVNNAGYGLLGDVAELDPTRQSNMIVLNCVALTELTQAVLPALITRRQGTIINIASTAAFQAIPTMAAYAASKAFVLRFTEGLWSEVQGTGVRTIAVCPGPTDTAFFEAAGDDAVMTRRRTPEQVVQTTFAALKANRPYVVDGAANAFLAMAARLAPTRLALRLARQTVSH